MTTLGAPPPRPRWASGHRHRRCAPVPGRPRAPPRAGPGAGWGCGPRPLCLSSTPLARQGGRKCLKYHVLICLTSWFQHLSRTAWCMPPPRPTAHDRYAQVEVPRTGPAPLLAIRYICIDLHHNCDMPQGFTAWLGCYHCERGGGGKLETLRRSEPRWRSSGRRRGMHSFS